MWTGHDTRLIVDAVIAIAIIIALVARLRLHAFLALFIGSIVMGLSAGQPAKGVVSSFEKGVGDVLGNVGIVLALGTMLGKLLAESGGAQQIAETIVARSRAGLLPWAMALIAMIVGIPMFFEIGLVLLVPLIFSVSRQVEASWQPRRAGPGAATAEEVRTRPGGGGRSAVIFVGIPALAGLSVLHGLVPPHPGPLIAIGALNANLGQTLAIGLVLAVPTVILAGPVFGSWISRRVHAEPPADLVEQVARDTRVENPPSFTITLATVLLPVVLMLARTVGDVALGSDSTVRHVCDFVGEPIIALLIAVLLALITFGTARGFDKQQLNRLLGVSLAPAASILLIIGAGGGFKQMLVDSGVGKAIATATQHSSLSYLLLAWLIAVLIRLATGSATVATVTAAGIMAPILAAQPHADRPLTALAVGAGSLFFSHVNDAGFWLVNQYFGMSVANTLKSWSVMETICSVVGLGMVLLASLVI